MTCARPDGGIMRTVLWPRRHNQLHQNLIRAAAPGPFAERSTVLKGRSAFQHCVLPLLTSSRQFAISDIWRLQWHSALHQLAMNMSSVFSSAYLLKIGLDYATVFAVNIAVLGLRFLLRPLMLLIVPHTGMRLALIAGTALVGLNYAAISIVDGVNWKLAVFCVISGLGNLVYWTMFHPVFAAAGEHHDRGRQMGTRQSLAAAATIAGPAVSGVILVVFGPWIAFGSAFIVTLLSAWPLLAIADTPVARRAPPGAWRAAKRASLLFFADGFMWTGAGVAWTMVLFERLGGRFELLGSALSAAAVAAAVASWLTGKHIDLGKGQHAALATAALAAAVFSMRALVGHDMALVTAVVIASTVMTGFYMPSLMTAFYYDAKSAPCVFRFQAAAETAWDAGAITASCICIAALAAGIPLQKLIWLALPAIAFQGFMLARIYNGGLPGRPAIS